MAQHLIPSVATIKSTSAAANPGKISTPSDSACCAIHLTTSLS